MVRKAILIFSCFFCFSLTLILPVDFVSASIFTDPFENETYIADSNQSEVDLSDETLITSSGQWQSLSTSLNLLSLDSYLEYFRYLIYGKPGGTNARVQFSPDNSNWYNTEGFKVSGYGAYDFNGTSQYINIPHSSAFNGTGAFTVSAWIKRDASSGQYVIAKSSGSAFNGGWFLALNNGWVANPSVDFFVLQTGGVYLGESKTINLNQWYHVVGVWDASLSGTNRVKLYIDGILANGTKTNAGSISNPASNMYDVKIGAREGPAAYMDGQISDVRFYTEALSETEIWNLYAYGTDPDNTNLVAHYKFNGDATDSSGNGNNGTATNGPTNTTTWSDLPHLGSSVLIDDESDLQVARFDGTNRVLDVTHASLMPDTFTVSAWVKMQPLSGVNNGKLISWNGANAYPAVVLDSGASNRPIIYMGANNYRYFNSSVNSISLLDGKWHHVAFTLPGAADADITNSKMYLDGQEVGVYATQSSGAQSAKVDAKIAHYTGSYYFRGDLANFALWNDVRTGSEILSDYQNGYIDTSDNNLVSFYPFAGNLTDVQGVKNATCSACPSYIKDIYRPQFEDAVEQEIDLSAALNSKEVALFDGINDYISLGHGEGMESTLTGDFTIMAWVKPDSVSANYIVSRGDTSTGGQNRIYRMVIEGGKAALFLRGNTGTVTVSGNTTISTNTWHHIAVVRRFGSQVEVYVDGVLDTTPVVDTAGPITFSATRDLMIGATQGGCCAALVAYSDGLISNVALYNIDLTAQQIQDRFMQGWIDINDNGLVGYWPLAGNANDIFGANDGTNNGALFVNDANRPVAFDFTTTPFTDFYYRLLYDASGSTNRTFATDYISLESSPVDTSTLTVSAIGEHNATTTNVANISLGGGFSLYRETGQSTVESIKIDQVGTFDPDYIDNLELNYIINTATSTCDTTDPGSGYDGTVGGSSNDLQNGSTTIDFGDMTVGDGNVVCLYPEYSLDDPTLSDFSEVGRTIKLSIATTTSVSLTAETATLNGNSVSPQKSTTYAQDGTQSLTLQMSDEVDDVTVFYVQNCALYIDEADAEPRRLTTNSVCVEYANFEDVTPIGSDRGQIRVGLRIRYIGQGGENAIATYKGSAIVQYFTATVNTSY